MTVDNPDRPLPTFVPGQYKGLREWPVMSSNPEIRALKFFRFYAGDGGERIARNVRLPLEDLTTLCHGASYAGGWYTDPGTGEDREVNVGEKLMLIVSEISEAMEAHRKGLMDDKLPHRPGVEVELADAVIRIFDLAGCGKLDLAGAILEKLAYNASRKDHKPSVRAAGGKAY